MKTIYWVLLILGCLFILGLMGIGMLMTSVSNIPISSDKYTIEVTGTNGLKFQGAIMKVEYGSVEQKSVEGTIPQSYELGGIMTSVVFQKMDAEGTLIVTVKDSSGRAIKQQSTSASYGIVTIATI